MNSKDGSLFFQRMRRLAIAAGLCILLGCNALLSGDDVKPVEPDSPGTTAKANPGPLPVDVHFRDGSSLKVTLRDERIEFASPYGKLLIPTADIRQIQFGFHIDQATAKRVDAAIAGLGSADFKERETATIELLNLAENAYPALVEAANSKDAEVAHRAEAVLTKLRDKIPSEHLDRPTVDVVQTADCKFTGRISADIFKVKTMQFGDQEVKLGDLVSLGGKRPADADLAAATDLPQGGIMSIHNQIGKTFVFKVIGGQGGTVWGSGVYTSDSDLATAAVHAGVVKPGKAGVVKILIVIPPPAFDGTSQNGVTTFPYGQFPGAFQIVK